MLRPVFADKEVWQLTQWLGYRNQQDGIAKRDVSG